MSISIDTTSSAYTNVLSMLEQLTSSSDVSSILNQNTSTQTSKSTNDIVEPIDLSNYYNNLASSDLLSQLTEGVEKTAEDLQAVMTTALENGMSVNDACNLSSAMAAYKANCTLLSSTFSLTV